MIILGNLLRTKNDFDKAYNIFEQIIVENPQDAEGYWNLLLCKYGITYVDDYDGSKKPTINRMSMTSIKDNQDYIKVLENADVVSKAIYKQQVSLIAKIQEDILKIVKSEEPYDIFISYKETVSTSTGTQTETLLKRVSMFLNDKEWEKASEYCDKVLDIDPENAQAYLCKFLIECEVSNLDELSSKISIYTLYENVNFKKAIRFADDKLKMN